jgi:hypothetical protein
MNPTQIKLATAGILFLLAWLFGEKHAVGRVSKELIIDANIDSDTFGEPIPVPTAEELAAHQHLVDLVNESDAAIKAFDASHPQSNEGI